MGVDSPADINVAWCEYIVAALCDAGLRTAIIVSGTRLAAFVEALLRRDSVTCLPAVDERAAAFFALGRARASREIVAVCTTSGSAVSNVVPALTEAWHSRIPLLLISCDRPKALSARSLPQTTDHLLLTSGVAQIQTDLPDPSPALLEGGFLARSLDGIVRCFASGYPAMGGPLHLNIPLRGDKTSLDSRELAGCQVPTLVPDRTRGVRPAFRRHATRSPAPALGGRGLVFIGSGADNSVDVQELREFCSHTRLPAISDAPVGYTAQQLPGGIISHGDIIAMLGQAPVPDYIIRVGGAPIGEGMRDLIFRTPTVVEAISAGSFTSPYASPGASIAGGKPVFRLADLVAAVATQDSVISDSLGRLESWAASYLEDALGRPDWNELQVIECVIRESSFELVHVANSLSIRLLNVLHRWSMSATRRVYANRGVSGIDGTIGTFLGEVSSAGVRGLLIIGDLAMIHDVSSLELAARVECDAVIVLLNNRGAGLFDLVPLGRSPAVKNMLHGNHVVDFGAICRGFGLRHQKCASVSQLRDAIASNSGNSRVVIVEAILDAGGAARSVNTLRGVTGTEVSA